MSLLCDQFSKLNEEFGKCIGGRGEFHGNFEQFRRRHHAICRSVKEADRFLMISNVACVCCNIIGFILVLFSSIFYRHVTVTRGVAEAVMYIYWLLGNTLSISLAVGMAIIVNNKVRQCSVFPMMIICRFTPVSHILAWTRGRRWKICFSGRCCRIQFTIRRLS